MISTKFEIDQVEKQYGLPGFFKASELNYDPYEVSDQAFADSLRKYPVHTKSACFLSNARFWDDAIHDPRANPQIGEKLLKAAEFWEIQDEVRERILEKVASRTHAGTVDDLPDAAFALVVDDPTTGAPLRLYPTLNSDLTKASAEQFYEMRDMLPLDWKRKAGRNLYEKIASHNLVLDDTTADYIERASGRGITSSRELAGFLRKRADIASVRKRADIAGKLRKCASMLEKEASSRALCEKVADTISQVDEELNLHKEYNDPYVGRPEEFCHCVLFKTAYSEIAKYIKLPDGTVYEKNEAFNKTADEFFNYHPGWMNRITSFGGEVDNEKVANQIETLPSDQLYIFHEIARANELTPTELPFDLSMFA